MISMNDPSHVVRIGGERQRIGIWICATQQWYCGGIVRCNIQVRKMVHFCSKDRSRSETYGLHTLQFWMPRYEMT